MYLKKYFYKEKSKNPSEDFGEFKNVSEIIEIHYKTWEWKNCEIYNYKKVKRSLISSEKNKNNSKNKYLQNYLLITFILKKDVKCKSF